MAATTRTPAATAPQIDLPAPAPAQARGTHEDRPPAARAALALRALLEAAVRTRARGHLGHRRRHRANQRRHRDWFVSICGAWTASTPAASPRGARPRPGAWPTCRRSSTRSGTSTATAAESSGPRPGAYGAWLRARGFDAAARRTADLERALALREALRALCLANHDDADAPAALAVLDGIAHAVAPAAALDAEPAHRRPRARGRRPRRGVRAGPGDRLRRARRRQLRAAEGVPARPLRLGLLRRLAQPLGPVVLDAHLRQPHQGRGVPAAARAARASLSERLVTAGARRFTVTPRSRPSAGPPATLSHDAMAARRQSPLASAAPAPSAFARATSSAIASSSTTAPPRRCTSRRYDLRRTVPRVVRLPAPTPLERWCREHGVAEAIVGGFFVRPGRHAAGRAAHERHRAARARRSTRRGATCAPACTSSAATSPSRGATSCPPSRRATCCRPARCSCATACPASTATSRASRPGQGQFDSDITAGRYPRAALGAGAARAAARRRLRRARRRRGRAHAGRAGRDARRPRRPHGAQPRRRRLDLAGLRRAGCATSRARITASCWPAGDRSRP